MPCLGIVELWSIEMNNHYEKARAIAEAAANRWDKFYDSDGILWLADQIRRAIATETPPVGWKNARCNGNPEVGDEAE